MKKKLFFAILATITLPMSFTACSDDDDTQRAGTIGEGSYSDTFYFKYNLYGATDAECQTITDTYNTVVNAIHPDGDEGQTKVTVYGKDSTDCVNTLTQNLTLAKQKLSSMNFDEDCDLSVIVYNSKGSEVYSQHIGTAENSDKVKTKVCQFYMNSKYNNDNYYVTSLYIRNEGTFHWWNKGVLKDGDPTSIDVNTKSGLAECVYVCARVSDASDAVPVSDVIIVQTSNPQETLIHNNMEYRLVKREAGEKGCNSNNLNSKNDSGMDIYLYYTTDPSLHRALKAKDLAICYRYTTTFFKDCYGGADIDDFDFSDVKNDNTEVELLQTYKIFDSWHNEDNSINSVVYPLLTHEDNTVNNGNLNFWNFSKSYEYNAIYMRCVYAKLNNKDNSPSTGTAKIVESGVERTCDWVRLWDNGPRWAVRNVGQDSSGRSAGYDVKEALSNKLWGSNWQLPSRYDYEQLMERCDYEKGENYVTFRGRGDYANNTITFYPRHSISGIWDYYDNFRYWTSTTTNRNPEGYYYFDQFTIESTSDGAPKNKKYFESKQYTTKEAYTRLVLKEE